MTAIPTPGNRRFRNQPQPIEIGKLFGKLPPVPREAEAALLGSLLHDPQLCGEVIEIIRSPEDFGYAPNAVVYTAMIEIYDETQSLDIVQLNQKLTDRKQLDHVGGTDYLVELAEAVPSAAGARHWARIVRDKGTIRRMIDAAGQILNDCYNTDDDAGIILDRAEQKVFELAESKEDVDVSELRELLQETYERLEAQEGEAITGVATGFFELDEMTNGLQKGEMIIIAARPSMGKTAFALNIAEHVAASNHEPVAVFSLEMGKQQLAQRLLCSRSGVDSHRLRRNMLSRDDFAQLSLTVGELSEAPIYIDDTPGLSLLALRAKARRLKARHDIKCVMIDYLQLMSASGAQSREQEVSSLSRGIKALARELDVPVICLSQLNRAAAQREGHRPLMSDLRESGSIEQDADVVMMLHREDYYHRGDEDYVDTNVAEVILAKQRNGPTGTVRLQFNGATTRFNNLASGAVAGF
ncbi:replicative DNA helicase [Mucisphaera calidilacus]|uniref:Replicative DNA helicase n=1 Tax=Mucisphaera calidilacus TaxID=2527982 RepID=A0A518BZG2_9BACT|nr:replicative DNA helicase [Mucisphaera calidilacus]QDU72349.1 Replicative DNA helicase [Mucisphaera calidilacus]